MSETKKTETKAKPQRVKLYIPRGASNEDPNFFISVNGVNYLLPKGEESLVPPCVAKEYERAMRAQRVVDMNKDRMISR